MKFLRNHWYDIGLVPMAISIIMLIVFWKDIDVLRRLALLNFFVIFWHQFEEYRFPGGEPAIINLAVQPKDPELYDRYPLNQNNAMFINVLAAYIVYLLPVLFPNVLCLAFMSVVFGLSQVVIHVIITPRKIGNRLYSPGSIAVVFGHVPVGIYWLWYTISGGMLGVWDVVIGIVYLAFFMRIVMIKIGYGVLSPPDSQYPFPEEELERHGYAEKIRKINHNLRHS